MSSCGSVTKRENLGKVVTAARRGRDLVRQILAYSRQQSVSLEPIKLGDIVDEASNLLRATLPTTTKIHTNLADDAGPVLADATQIHEDIINLGTNAAHAIGEQTGSIEIELKSVEVNKDSTDFPISLTPGPHAQLNMSDTGCGMDEKTIARIFDPYFTTKPPGEGTGLGLAAVQGIIASHKGAIKVSSTPGQGTVFMIYLPLLPEEGSSAD